MSPEPAVPRPPGASRYGWFFALVVVLLIAYITINNATNDDEGGSTGPEVGKRMPPFAVPLALGDLEGDANVATEAGQGEAGARPACEVRGAEILNICEQWEKGPVALAFLATRGGRCVDGIDELEAVREDYPTIRFATIAIRGDREDLRDLIRRRGWGMPVGYDHDGILANMYGVAVCPQITFARRGGTVTRTLIGEPTDRELRTALDDLVDPAR
jgi:hypothetical protein